jgi:hypothetical protein
VADKLSAHIPLSKVSAISYADPRGLALCHKPRFHSQQQCFNTYPAGGSESCCRVFSASPQQKRSVPSKYGIPGRCTAVTNEGNGITVLGRRLHSLRNWLIFGSMSVMAIFHQPSNAAFEKGRPSPVKSDSTPIADRRLMLVFARFGTGNCDRA